MNRNKISIELDPFFQGIIRKKPFDLLEAYSILEAYIIYLKNLEGRRRGAEAFSAIEQDKDLISIFEKVKDYNVTFDLASGTLEDLALLLSFFSIARKVTTELKDDKDGKKQEKMFEKVKKNAGKLSYRVALYSKAFAEKIEAYYSDVVEIDDVDQKTDDQIGLFIIKMGRYGAFVEYIGEAFLEGSRNNYVIFLPTYLAVYFDNYNRPEVIGSRFNELLFTDSRKPFYQKVMGKDDLVQKNSELTKETYDYWQELRNSLLAFMDEKVGDGDSEYRERIARDSLKTLDSKTGFDYPGIRGGGLFQPFYWFSESPTGVFVATTRSYSTADAFLENTLLTIVNHIVKAMRKDATMMNLPQYDNPKIIRENNEKLKEFQNGNWSNMEISALYFVPIPTATSTNLNFTTSKQDYKFVKKPEEFVSAKVVEASKCIYGEKCTNDQFAKALGPLIKSKKGDPDNNEAVRLIKQLCKTAKPDAHESLRMNLGLPLIEGESNEDKCKRVEKALLETVQKK